MKKTKRIVALLCAAAMALSLTACGKDNTAGGQKDEGGADIAAMLTGADTKLGAVKNMKADMNMDMDIEMSAEGQTMNMKMKMDLVMAMFAEPLKAKMDMNMTMDMGELSDGAQDVKAEMYMLQKEDGSYAIYTNMNGQWAQEVVDATAAMQYDPAASMSLYLDSAESFENKGEDTVRGMKTTKLEGVISNEALNKVMAASGMEKNMESFGIGDISEIYKDMGDMPIMIWISEEGYPVRYEMDMTGIMSTMFEKMMTQMGDEADGMKIKCNNVKLNMECYDFDKVEDFEIPAEVTQVSAA